MKTVNRAIAATKPFNLVGMLAIVKPPSFGPMSVQFPDSMPVTAPATRSDSMTAPEALHLESTELSRAFPISFWPLGNRTSTMRPIGLPFFTCMAVTVT